MTVNRWSLILVETCLLIEKEPKVDNATHG